MCKLQKELAQLTLKANRLEFSSHVSKLSHLIYGVQSFQVKHACRPADTTVLWLHCAINTVILISIEMTILLSLSTDLQDNDFKYNAGYNKCSIMLTPSQLVIVRIRTQNFAESKSHGLVQEWPYTVYTCGQHYCEKSVAFVGWLFVRLKGQNKIFHMRQV